MPPNGEGVEPLRPHFRTRVRKEELAPVSRKEQRVRVLRGAGDPHERRGAFVGDVEEDDAGRPRGFSRGDQRGGGKDARE